MDQINEASRPDGEPRRLQPAIILEKAFRWSLGKWERFWDRIVYPRWLARKTGVTVGRGVLVKGWPEVEIDPGGTVTLGDAVTLNSRSRRYHAHLVRPVKLYAESGARIRVGARTRLHGTCLHAFEEISIGENCLIAGNTQIFDSNGHTLSFENVANRLNTHGPAKPIRIGDNVWIGLNCLILPGVTIGDGSVIGAGSVVTRDVPSRVVAAGNPARVLRADAGNAALQVRESTPKGDE